MNDHVEIGSQELCSCIKGLSFGSSSPLAGTAFSITLLGSSGSGFRDDFAFSV